MFSRLDQQPDSNTFVAIVSRLGGVRKAVPSGGRLGVGCCGAGVVRGFQFGRRDVSVMLVGAPVGWISRPVRRWRPRLRRRLFRFAWLVGLSSRPEAFGRAPGDRDVLVTSVPVI